MLFDINFIKEYKIFYGSKDKRRRNRSISTSQRNKTEEIRSNDV